MRGVEFITGHMVYNPAYTFSYRQQPPIPAGQTSKLGWGRTYLSVRRQFCNNKKKLYVNDCTVLNTNTEFQVLALSWAYPPLHVFLLFDPF